MTLQECQLIERQVLKEITRDAAAWKKFLTAAARFYKYSFSNQILIYGQNPEAAAYADKQEWERVSRRVKQGCVGITLYNNPSKHGENAVYDAYEV